MSNKTTDSKLSYRLYGEEREKNMVKDAYWTIYNNSLEVIVFDEIKDCEIKRFCKKFDTIEACEEYIKNFMQEWSSKIAILQRI